MGVGSSERAENGIGNCSVRHMRTVRWAKNLLSLFPAALLFLTLGRCPVGLLSRVFATERIACHSAAQQGLPVGSSEDLQSGATHT